MWGPLKSSTTFCRSFYYDLCESHKMEALPQFCDLCLVSLWKLQRILEFPKQNDEQKQ